MSTKNEGYDYDTKWLRFSDRIARNVRNKVFKLFTETINPGAEDSVLDVGVTSDTGRESSNFFEKSYPWTQNIVAVSTEDGGYLQKEYPGLKFVKADGTALPFKDQSFDIVFSAAVAEHVGSFERQYKFYNEAFRVGRKVFITTPDRLFPVEVHTGIPFLHYLPKKLHRKILSLIGQNDLAEESSLNLLTRRELKKILINHPEAQIIRRFNSLIVIKK